MAEDVIYQAGPVSSITLNRADKRNALSFAMIKRLREICLEIKHYGLASVVKLNYKGQHFCAGADLNWMQEGQNNTHEHNMAEARILSEMFQALNTLPCPVIGIAQGCIFGGGIGLLACCDYAIATAESRWCFSEVKWGLIPATIMPFVVAKTGIGFARNYMLSGLPFTGKDAHLAGLTHATGTADKLDEEQDAWAQHVLSHNKKGAMRQTKELLQAYQDIHDPIIERSIQAIAERRSSEEAQAGLKEFLLSIKGKK